MSSVVSRHFVSSPSRDASETWRAIVAMLTRDRMSTDRDELLAITGVASSIIADHAPEDAAIVVTADGPRTRIYCLYDDAAIEGDDADESTPAFDPLQGDWAISLPCNDEDLTWVRNALAQHSTRITARSKTETFAIEEDAAVKAAGGLVFDPKGFLGQ